MFYDLSDSHSNAQQEVDYRLAKWIVRNMEKEQLLTPDETKPSGRSYSPDLIRPPGALRQLAKPSEAVRRMAKKITLIEPTAALPESPTDVSRGREKVAAYARVSTGNEDQATSLVAQTDYYRKKIQGNPAWDFVGIYADDPCCGI